MGVGNYAESAAFARKLPWLHFVAPLLEKFDNSLTVFCNCQLGVLALMRGIVASCRSCWYCFALFIFTLLSCCCCYCCCSIFLSDSFDILTVFGQSFCGFQVSRDMSNSFANPVYSESFVLFAKKICHTQL